jgi:hypothetical protein
MLDQLAILAFAIIICLCYVAVMTTLARSSAGTQLALIVLTLLFAPLGLIVATFVGCAGIRKMHRRMAPPPKRVRRTVAAPPRRR